MFDEMHNELDEMRNDLAETQNELVDTKSDLVEIQSNLAKTQNNLNRMNAKYDRSVRNGVELMRSLGMSDQEIVSRLSEQYQLTEVQAASFLETQRSV